MKLVVAWRLEAQESFSMRIVSMSELVRVGKTHCQGHQDPSKSVSIFDRETEANLKMVWLNAVFPFCADVLYVFQISEESVLKPGTQADTAMARADTAEIDLLLLQTQLSHTARRCWTRSAPPCYVHEPNMRFPCKCVPGSARLMNGESAPQACGPGESDARRDRPGR